MTDAPESRSIAAVPRNGARLAVEATLVFALAALIRVAGLGEEALHDELYNYLAAKSYLAQGTFALVEGGAPYVRGALFTHVVAQCMALFGDALWVARLPALCAGSLVAVLTFVWTALLTNRWAAWTAGILVCIDPLLVQLSQVVRFYSFQHLAFLGSAIVVYFLVADPTRRAFTALAGAVVAAGLLYLATLFQPVSLIGMVGLVLFVAGSRGIPLVRSLDARGRRRVAVGTAALAVSLTLLVVTGTNWIDWAIHMATYADLWAAPNVGNVRYYYAILYNHFAPLLALFPLLLVLAFSWRPRLTALCTCVFVVAMITHSLMAWKAERYFSYILPFFFVILAIGLVRAVPVLYRFVDGVLERQGGVFGGPDARTVLAAALVALILAFGALGNRALLLTGRLITRDHSSSFPLMGPRDGALSWSRFAAKVAPIVDSVDVVVSSDDVKAVHYLGRLDYDFSPDHLRTPRGHLPEFSIDRRVNAPMVESAEAMEIITHCHDSGILVVERLSLSKRIRPAVDYVASVAEPIQVPRDWGILALRWSNVAESEAASEVDCSAMRQHTDMSEEAAEG